MQKPGSFKVYKRNELIMSESYDNFPITVGSYWADLLISKFDEWQSPRV